MLELEQAIKDLRFHDSLPPSRYKYRVNHLTDTWGLYQAALACHLLEQRKIKLTIKLIKSVDVEYRAEVYHYTIMGRLNEPHATEEKARR